MDFSYQFNLGREKVEKKIFSILCELSKKLYKTGVKTGALIVFGAFDNNAQIGGMRQLGNKKVDKYINIGLGNYEEDVAKILESNDDGAIIVNQGGQIIGLSIYLHVDDPNLDIPEGTGTRHISAASFSKREDVLSVFTLSEENLAVRLWRDGQFLEQFKPDEVEM